MSFRVPVGTPTAMLMTVTVTMTGDRRVSGDGATDPIKGLGSWAVNLGGRAQVAGGAVIAGPGPGAGTVTYPGGINDRSNVHFAAFTGADTATITMSWTERRYLTVFGEARAVVGNITVSCNGGSIVFTPPNDPNGFAYAPGLWVDGQSAIYGAPATTAMTCSIKIGGVEYDKFSFQPYVSENLAFYTGDPYFFGTLPPVAEPAGWGITRISSWTEDGTAGSCEATGVTGTPGSYTIGAPPLEYLPHLDGSGAPLSLAWRVDSAINGHVHFQPPLFDLSGYTTGDPGADDGLGFSTHGSSPSVVLISTAAKDTVTIRSKVSNWPSGSPVKSAPLSLWNGAWCPSTEKSQCDFRLNPFQVTPNFNILTAPATHSDALGIGPTTAFVTTGLPSRDASDWAGSDGNPELPSDCFVVGMVGADTRNEPDIPFPSAPVTNDDAHYRLRHNLDPNGPTVVRSEAATIDMWQSPTLLTITRAPSKSIDDGTDHTLWQTVGGGWTVDADITVSAGTGGVAIKKTAGGSGMPGAARPLTGGSAGLRRAFRQYRYLRLRIAADSKTTCRFSLWSNVHNDTANPVLLISYNLTLVNGDNTYILDLVKSLAVVNPGFGGNQSVPYINGGAQGSGSSAGPDPIGFWSLHSQDTAGGWHSTLLTANPNIGDSGGGGTDWQNADAWWMRIDNIVLGVLYTLKEITCFDREDGNRTVLRVLGDPCPGTGQTGSQPVGSQTNQLTGLMSTGAGGNVPDYVFRILANGRPVAGFPSAFKENSLPVVVDDLVARWNDTIDGGAGIWTVTVDEPTLTAIVPPNWLEVVPGSVTSTGFQLRARAMYLSSPTDVYGIRQPAVNIGWNALVGYQIKASFRWAGVIEGIALDAQTRKPCAGKTAIVTMSNPPTTATEQQFRCVCDDDGYFAISVRQPLAHQSGTLRVKHVRILTDRADIVDTGATDWVCLNRNTLFLMVYVHPLTPSRVANLSTSDGAFHRVARSCTHIASGTAIGEGGQNPGQDGLSYWRYQPGAPRAWNTWGWTAKAIIITPSVIDDYPDIVQRSDGRLYVVFDRQTAAGPRVADTWECFSDDSGLTWSDPVMKVALGQFPRIHASPDGSVYRTAWIDDGSNQGTGTIQGQYQFLGDVTPSTAFVLRKLDDGGHLVPIVVEEGKYDIGHLYESAGRWILTCVEVGATSPTEFVSADDAGGTFVRLGTATAGMDIGPGGNMAFVAKAFETAVNVPTTGVQTVDGLTTGDNQTYVLGAQTAPDENGFWISSSTVAWKRPAWQATGAVAQPGTVAWIAPGGTLNGAKFVYMSNTANVIIDTNPQTWAVSVPPVMVHVASDFTAAPVASAVLPTLSHTPNGGDFSVFIDGIRQPDTSDYYSVAGTTVTLNLVGTGGQITLANIVTGVTVRYTYT